MVWCRRYDVAVWAYCLLPNHVHLVAVPESEHGLRRVIGETDRRYTSRVNARKGWRGHLLVKVAPMLERIGEWGAYLAAKEDELMVEALRRHEKIGRVPGGEGFVETLEAARACRHRSGKRGRERGASQN